MIDVWELYQRVWHQAEAEDVAVMYNGIPPRGEHGWFHPQNHPNGRSFPVIHIARPYYSGDGRTPTQTVNNPDLPPPDLLAELLTLAHEYGHFRSWKAGGRTAAYEAAVIALEKQVDSASEPMLSEEQRELIRTEEETAWQIGRQILDSLGFDRWDAYDARRARSLEVYEKLLRAEYENAEDDHA